MYNLTKLINLIIIIALVAALTACSIDFYKSRWGYPIFLSYSSRHWTGRLCSDTDAS